MYVNIVSMTVFNHNSNVYQFCIRNDNDTLSIRCLFDVEIRNEPLLLVEMATIDRFKMGFLSFLLNSSWRIMSM